MDTFILLDCCIHLIECIISANIYHYYFFLNHHWDFIVLKPDMTSKISLHNIWTHGHVYQSMSSTTMHLLSLQIMIYYTFHLSTIISFHWSDGTPSSSPDPSYKSSKRSTWKPQAFNSRNWMLWGIDWRVYEWLQARIFMLMPPA